MGLDFSQLLIVGLIGLLFAKDYLLDLLTQKFGFKKKTSEESTPAWAQTLAQYYNHDTTDQNKKVIEKLDSLLLMEEKEHENADKFRDTLKDISNTLANIDKYGVKCRDK